MRDLEDFKSHFAYERMSFSEWYLNYGDILDKFLEYGGFLGHHPIWLLQESSPIEIQQKVDHINRAITDSPFYAMRLNLIGVPQNSGEYWFQWVQLQGVGFEPST